MLCVRHHTTGYRAAQHKTTESGSSDTRRAARTLACIRAAFCFAQHTRPVTARIRCGVCSTHDAKMRILHSAQCAAQNAVLGQRERERERGCAAQNAVLGQREREREGTGALRKNATAARHNAMWRRMRVGQGNDQGQWTMKTKRCMVSFH